MAFELFKMFGSIFINNDEANKSISKTDEKAEGLGKKFLSGIGTAAKWGAGIAAAAGTAAVAIGVKAVGAAAEFEKSFAKVNTLLADTTDLDGYKKKILEMSNETGVSTEDLCESIYSAISASVDQESALEFTGKALKLAEGGFTDAATAVDVLTTAINAYGLESSDAEKVSDMLITTQNLGKTTVDELASSMGKIIPTANANNVSLDQLCGAYTVMTANGIATAESTTYMNSMLNELGKSSTTAAKAFREGTQHIKDGGMTFAEAMEEGWGLSDVLSILDEQAYVSGVSLSEMFGSAEAGKAAMTLWNNAEKLDQNIMAMGESAGATEEAYTKMHDTVSTKMASIKNHMANITAELGNKLMPIVNDVLEWVLNNMPAIQEVMERVFKAIETVVMTVGGIFQSIFLQIDQALSNSGLTFQDVFAAIQEVVQNAFTVLQELWELLLKPVFQAIWDMLSVVADYFAQKMPEIQAFVKKAFDDIKVIWEKHLKPCFEAIKNFLNNVLVPAFKFVFQNIIQPIVDSVFRTIGQLWEKTLKPVFTNIVDFIKNVFSGNFSGAFKNIINIVEGIWTGIETIIKTPVNACIGIINKFIQGLNTLKIPDWVPFVGGASINIPEIPLLAKGGTIVKGGKAIVGEAGAELIDLPAGARVTPLTNGSGDVLGVAESTEILKQILIELKTLRSDLYDTLIEALTNGVDIVWSDRELARLVRKYA